MTESFVSFVEARLPRLVRLAAVLAGDRGVAEDVVQDVLLRASKRWSTISEVGAPDAYLRRMIVNEYVSWRRKWSRQVPQASIEDPRDVPDHAARLAERDDLSRRLDKLPSRQRAVLVLRYYEDLSDDEIASIMHCAVGTVRSHASRALTTLRVQMENELDGHTTSVATPRKDH